MITSDLVYSFLEEKIKNDKVFIVDLKVSKNNQISVLLDSMEGVNISYCVDISRLIEGSLDREEEDFELEVSSPGIGPFKVWQQYKKYEGKEVLVKKDGMKPQKGFLTEVDEKTFSLEFTEKVKEEGKKKKIQIIQKLTFQMEEVASVEPVIKFKE